MQENPETTETNQEKEEKPKQAPETVPDPEAAPEATPETNPDPENPAPKRRGRPEGAKDRAPRKKKVVVVEEHILEPENAASAPVTPPDPPVQEPDSPRTLIREAADHILRLKNVTKMARKAHLQEAYTKRLHSLS
jgi:hypothetical protein